MRSILLAAALLLSIAPAAARAQAGDAERLVAVLDYVAADYPATVSDGGVVDAAEYQEQIDMVGAARRLVADLPAIPAPDLDALDRAIRARSPAAEVARLCAALRERAIGAYAITTAPAYPPSLERGAELFRASCVQCHGPRGAGDGPEAARHDPRPANLLDPERMAAATPYRAYTAITYGIAGTAMPAMNLPPGDRWSLAFYAMALRHLGAEEAPPGAGAGAGGTKLGLATLAGATDAELDRMLAATIDDPAARRAELGRLRAVAPFDRSAAEAPLAIARRALTEARDLAMAGDARGADRRVLDAYLRGIEEAEGAIRARDAALVAAIEDGISRLRAAIATPHTEAVAARTAEVLALLDRAEIAADLPVGAGAAGAALLALAAALIVVREGIEAALIVAAILAIVRRAALARSTAPVHAGWLAALGLGAVTFAAARTTLSRTPLDREAVEGAVSLLAAAVLFATSFWLISKADAARWLAYVKARAAGSAARGGAVGLFALAFLAAYREAFETVLFFEALLAGEAARALPLGAGAAAGAVALVAAVLAIGRLERRLPLGAFFAASGALLSALAVALLGHGLHALESSSFLIPRPIAFVRVEWLGIYPDALSLGAQAALAGIIVAGTLWVRYSSSRAVSTPASPSRA